GLAASMAMGVKLVTASYFSAGCTAALVVKVEDDNMRTEPSVGARETYSAPMAPPAPGRFSTTTELPSLVERASASTRANVSLLPPGGKGTTNVMVLGKATDGWAAAIEDTQAVASTSAPVSSVLSFMACLRFLSIGNG